MAVFGLGGEAGGTTTSHPRLALDGTRPLTVRGSGFRAHERVRLVLHRPAGARHRRATAGAGGTFAAGFRACGRPLRRLLGERDRLGGEPRQARAPRAAAVPAGIDGCCTRSRMGSSSAPRQILGSHPHY